MNNFTSAPRLVTVGCIAFVLFMANVFAQEANEKDEKAFVHAVYFWLKKDMKQDQIKALEEGLKSLRKIESIRHLFIGKPASTNRPIIDRTYDYALIVVFDDKPGYDIYDEHAVHDVFRNKFGKYFLKVRVYDSE